MSNNPVRLQSGYGIPITQTDNALDVNIASGLDSADPATQTTLAESEKAKKEKKVVKVSKKTIK